MKKVFLFLAFTGFVGAASATSISYLTSKSTVVSIVGDDKKGEDKKKKADKKKKEASCNKEKSCCKAKSEAGTKATTEKK